MSEGQKIQVSVRLRPPNEQDKTPYNVVCDKIKRQVSLRTDYTSKSYNMDHIFDGYSTQKEIYRQVADPIVQEVLKGYNCTILAYGQTGSGKTFTMEGEGMSSTDWENSKGAGIIPRCMSTVFSTLGKQDSEFTIRVSYLEIYNETINDLLNPVQREIKIFSDKSNVVTMQNLEEIIVNNKEEMYRVLERGAGKRRTAATNMNLRSSRSHALFIVTIHMKEVTDAGEELVRTGKLTLVDLAGSENIGRSGAQGTRAMEAGNINKSLLQLSLVISSLVEAQSFVPYRGSKLTRLLQDSLGGRSKTALIATVSPSKQDLDETVSTLDYALKAKSITNKPQINQVMKKSEMLRHYSDEMERLRRDLEATRAENGYVIAKENYDLMISTLESRKLRIDFLEETMVDKDAHIQQLTDSSDRYMRDMMEAKYVASQHAETEQRIKKEFEKLLDTVQAGQKETKLLHSKVSRQQTVHQFNQSITTQYLTKFQLEETKAKALRENLASATDDGLRRTQLDVQRVVNHLNKLDTDLEGALDAAAADVHNSVEKLKNVYAPITGEHQVLLSVHNRASSDTFRAFEQIRDVYKTGIQETLNGFITLTNCLATQEENIQNIQKTNGELLERMQAELEATQTTMANFENQQKAQQKAYAAQQKAYDELLVDLTNKKRSLETIKATAAQETDSLSNLLQANSAVSAEVITQSEALTDTNSKLDIGHATMLDCVKKNCAEHGQGTTDLLARHVSQLDQYVTDTANDMRIRSVSGSRVISSQLSDGHTQLWNILDEREEETATAVGAERSAVRDRTALVAHELNTLITNEMREVTPAGNTPESKNRGSYPRKFVGTAPREELAKRFLDEGIMDQLREDEEENIEPVTSKRCK